MEGAVNAVNGAIESIAAPWIARQESGDGARECCQNSSARLRHPALCHPFRYFNLSPDPAPLVVMLCDQGPGQEGSAALHEEGAKAPPLAGRDYHRWPALVQGCEAAPCGQCLGVGAEGEAVAEAIEARLRTGRPLAAEEWIAEQEAAMGRRMSPEKRGPKPKRKRV